MNALDQFAQLAGILLFDVCGKNAFVGAVIDHNQVRALMLKLDCPLLRLEIAESHLNLSAVQPKTMINHPRAFLLETPAEKADLAGGDVQVEVARAGRKVELSESGLLFGTVRRDRAENPAGGAERECAAVRLIRKSTSTNVCWSSGKRMCDMRPAHRES